MSKRVKTNHSLKSDYNLRSKRKRIKSEDKNNATNDMNINVINSQNCEDLTETNVSTVSQTTNKLTKMPNKLYNLRPRRSQSSADAVTRLRHPISSVKLNDLPDDCLLCIFEKLDTIRDKCLVQSVNKRFNFLVNRLLRAQKAFTVNSTFGPNLRSSQILSKSMCNNVLTKCPNLQVFKMPGFYAKDLSSTNRDRIGDREMHALANACPELRELDICGCGNVSESGVNYICSECPKLEKLSISFCHSVTGVSLKKLTKSFKTLSLNLNDITPPIMQYLLSVNKGQGRHLTELNVCAYNTLETQENVLKMICNNFVDLQCLRYSIASRDVCEYGLFGQLTNLTHLAFDSNTLNLNDNQFISILSGCQHLKSLFIRYEVGRDEKTISDKSFRRLPNLCPNLEKLHFHPKGEPIHAVTDYSIENFVLLRHLEVLSLKSFANIGDSVIKVIKSCPQLNYLYLLSCPNVTTTTLDALVLAAKSQPTKKIKFNISGTAVPVRRKKRKIPINLIDCSDSDKK